MAKQACIKIVCDRCQREEIRPFQSEQSEQPEFEAKMGDKKILYQDLCNKCQAALTNLWSKLKEWGSKEGP